MTSNARQTRAAGNHDAANAQPADAKRSKTFLDKWVEPPLRPPAPSFMDNPHQDIVRHGVLSTMAPLGTLPSSKVKKLAKTEGPRRLAFVKKGEQSVSAASTPREAVTPEPQLNPSGRRSEPQKMDETEWNPTTPVAQSGTLKITGRGRNSPPPQVSPYSTVASSIQEELDVDWTDRAVKWAVSEAVATGHLPTGYALRSLFDDHRSNPRIVKLYHLISTQEATEEEQAEFRSLMQYKKREGRTNKRAEQMFAQSSQTPSTPVQFTAVNYKSSPVKVVPEATTDLTRSPHKASEGPLHKKHKAHHLDGSKHIHLKVNGNSTLSNGIHLRSRSNSASSSDSELSSIDEARLTENHRESSVFSAQNPEEAVRKSLVNKTEFSTAIPDPALMGRRNSRAQPMARQKTLGPKLEAWDVNTNSEAPSAPSSPHSSASFINHNNNTSQNIVPALSDSFATQATDALSAQTSQPSQHPSIRFMKKASSAAVTEADNHERTIRLKRKARDVTENHAQVHDSFDRHRVVSRGAQPEADGGDSIAAAGQAPKSGQILRFRSSQASRRINDEFDDLGSPTLPSFTPDGAPRSSSNSRAGTPGTSTRPSRKPRSGLRMKTSPMKKKAGPSAGIPRASGERNSPVGNGATPHNQDDNDDYCSSCGGNGDLVCCDGCTRSFHFKCLDPPLSETLLPDNWFCNHCNSSRNPRTTDDRSMFGQLLGILHKKNPSAFHLPKDIREYFEGVRTGGEGEYEEGVPQKPKRYTGYEEPPDYLKLKDGKGNFIICHECHKGAGDARPIIPCSYCSLQWHLDCLDPPLANPPPQGKPWRCPCHVDDLLARVPGALGPAHRFRKIKGASIIRPAFARGFKNDGHIEIEFAPSDDEDDGFFERKEYGKVYKLPEDGIKLDFMSRIRSLSKTPIVSIPPVVPRLPTKRRFTAADRRSIQERQAALNVAQLATQDEKSDGAQILIEALLSEASPSMVALIAQGDATNIANNVLGQGDKQSLLAMKALIEHKLKQIDCAPSSMPEEEPRTIKDEVLAEDDVDMLL